MGENLTIAHILCSRLCHDIIGPLSSISTGLELLEENPQSPMEDIVALLKKSATAANQCLSLFRLVYGDSLITHVNSIEQLIDKMQQGLDLTKFQVTAAVTDQSFTSELERQALYRSVACLTLCATEMAPYGGRIIWSSPLNDGNLLNLVLEGATLVLPSEIIENLSESSSAPCSPRTICAYLARSYAKNAYCMIKIVQPNPHTIMLSLQRHTVYP